jgi:NAD(P)H-nitrite reductase large subunit
MHICHCRPVKRPLDTDSLLDAVKDGASSMKEVVAKTEAGTNCHGCAPTLAKLKPVVRELAAQRNATGASWPTQDQYVCARKAIMDGALK